MHVNRAFAWTDPAELLAFIADVSFAHLFVPSPEGPLVAHVPVVVTADGNLRFHLARANPPADHLDGTVALASFAGPDAYISPDWYRSADQVPTWNYVTVEARGRVRRLSETDLIGNLDALSIAHETRLLPKKPWGRAKMRPGLFEGMLKAIVAFELEVENLRGTRKLGQNKNSDDREGAVAGLEAAGKPEVAALMRNSSPRCLGEGDHAQHGGGGIRVEHAPHVRGSSGGRSDPNPAKRAPFTAAAPPPLHRASRGPPPPANAGEDLE